MPLRAARKTAANILTAPSVARIPELRARHLANLPKSVVNAANGVGELEGIELHGLTEPYELHHHGKFVFIPINTCLHSRAACVHMPTHSVSTRAATTIR